MNASFMDRPMGGRVDLGGTQVPSYIANRVSVPVDLDGTPFKDLLQKDRKRICTNIPMVALFWAHVILIVGLIIFVMSNDFTPPTSTFLQEIVNFLSGSEVVRKLFEVMIGTCVTGGLFALSWIWFVRSFEESSIMVSVLVSHVFVLSLAIRAIIKNTLYLIAIYGVGLLIIDAWLYCHRQDFPFSKIMMKMGNKCASDNPKMKYYAYAFAPLQMFTYIFWLMGMLFCCKFDWGVNNWYFIVALFMFSYTWMGWFWHSMVHSYMTVRSSFWALGMRGGSKKARQSCRVTMTYSQGPTAVGSFIMAWTSIFSLMIRLPLRSVCYCFGDGVYRSLCNCTERIIRRYNESTLAVVNLFDLDFRGASYRLMTLFNRTGMTYITTEVAWSVPITVGTFCGCIVTGGIGLGFHHHAFGDSDCAALDILFFFVYALLGGSITAIVLAPLRSVLTSIFVVWAEDPRSLASGQPELYGELLEAVVRCPGVKNVIHTALLQGQVDVRGKPFFKRISNVPAVQYQHQI